jgi:hypothetical protein
VRTTGAGARAASEEGRHHGDRRLRVDSKPATRISLQPFGTLFADALTHISADPVGALDEERARGHDLDDRQALIYMSDILRQLAN